MRWMHLRLHAPLAAFGGEMIDAHGVTRDFPSQSMMTGLLANAMGWTRAMRREHQRLQERIVFGALWEHEPGLSRLTDYQTAQLAHDDRAWTTSGRPAGRQGGAATFRGAHQRWRDYRTDVRMAIALRLEPADESPALDEVAAALDRPARTLFVGRKSCLPSSPIFQGWVAEAEDARAAMREIAPSGASTFPASWPESEGTGGAHRTTVVTDERNWLSGLHGGARRLCEGRIAGTRDSG